MLAASTMPGWPIENEMILRSMSVLLAPREEDVALGHDPLARREVAFDGDVGPFLGSDPDAALGEVLRVGRDEDALLALLVEVGQERGLRDPDPRVGVGVGV